MQYAWAVQNLPIHDRSADTEKSPEIFFGRSSHITEPFESKSESSTTLKSQTHHRALFHLILKPGYRKNGKEKSASSWNLTPGLQSLSKHKRNLASTPGEFYSSLPTLVYTPRLIIQYRHLSTSCARQIPSPEWNETLLLLIVKGSGLSVYLEEICQPKKNLSGGKYAASGALLTTSMSLAVTCYKLYMKDVIECASWAK